MVELSAFPEVAVILVNVGCLHSRTWDCCLEARRFRRTEGCNERIIFCENQKTHLCSWLVILLLNELDRVVEKWVFYFKYICIYKTIANILYCDIIYDYSILQTFNNSYHYKCLLLRVLQVYVYFHDLHGSISYPELIYT